MDMLQKLNSDFQEHSLTHFIVNRTEGDSLKGNFVFTNNRRSETGGQGLPYLQSELAALDISHSAFCVHSIFSALIITHARAQFPPHFSASPFTLIFSPKKWQNPMLCFCCIHIYTRGRLHLIHHTCDCVRCVWLCVHAQGLMHFSCDTRSSLSS